MTGVYQPGQSVALYVNGEKVAEDTTAVPAAIGLSGLFKIGARADNTSQGHWDGQIDEVRVIGRALSDAEIQGLLTVGAWKFEEGSGNLALDASGHGWQGQIQGAQWVAGGISGQALDFDGTDDYVQFDAEPEIENALTVSAWVRPEQGPTGKGRMVVGTYRWGGGGGNQRGWALGDQYGDNDEFHFRIYDDTGSLASAGLTGFFATYLNQWVHVTGVYQPGQSVALYVNGAKVAEDTSAVPAAIGLSGVFKIGARADNTSQGHWNGQIDEVRVIARALSDAEIRSLLTVGVWKLDEGSGNIALDASGYGNHGQIQGAQWVAGGISAQALDFDGTDDYIQFDSEPEIENALTVSAWVRPEQGPAGKGRMVVGTYRWGGGGGNQRGWALGDQYGDNDEFHFRVYDDTGSLASAGLTGFFATYLNQWVHVTGVYQPGQSVALYVNGTKVAEDTSAVPAAIGLSGLFKIGARADNANQGHWDGQIDEVRVIGRALSEAEIQSLLTVGVWKFEEGSGNLATDASGHGRQGEIQGAQWVAGGISAQALDFDPDWASYVQFDSEPEIEGALTVSAWVRPEKEPTGKGRMVVGTYKYGGSGASRRGWSLGNQYGGSNEFYFRVHDDAGNYASARLTGFFTTYLNQWVHVTGVYQPGQSVALYVNGAKVAEDTTAVPAAIGLSGVFKIGARADNTNQGHWDGQIDEVQVIGHALSETEVQDLMQPYEQVQSRPEQTISIKYYHAGGQRVAMRRDGALYYILTDHLSSTSVIVDENGGVVARQGYYPYGGERYVELADPNAFTAADFTGQYFDSGTGLHFYNARYYSSALGRFISADTVVPGAGNPQAFNRYSYVLNDPLRFVDPSGHKSCSQMPWECDDPDDLEIKLGDRTKAELEQLAQDQFNPASYPTGCAPFSMAMAINLYTDGNISGADMAAYMQSFRKDGGAAKTPWFGMTPRNQAEGLNRLFRSIDPDHPPFVAEYSEGGTSADLIDNLNNGYVTIVSVSWGKGIQGVRKGVGHALAVVGYDPSNGEFMFLDPGKGKLITDFKSEYAGVDFLFAWQQQPNMFIPAGAMVTIKPNP